MCVFIHSWFCLADWTLIQKPQILLVWGVGTCVKKGLASLTMWHSPLVCLMILTGFPIKNVGVQGPCAYIYILYTIARLNCWQLSDQTFIFSYPKCNGLGRRPSTTTRGETLANCTLLAVITLFVWQCVWPPWAIFVFISLILRSNRSCVQLVRFFFSKKDSRHWEYINLYIFFIKNQFSRPSPCSILSNF